MDNDYKELTEISLSVVKLYLKLAELEKQGKKESKEYEDIIYLLPKALEIEKRKYLTIVRRESYVVRAKKVLSSAEKIGNILIIPTEEILVALRMLNYRDNEKYYSLLDSTLRSVKIHYYIEEIFLKELLKNVYKVESSSRGILIDYIYAILASSNNFDIEKLELMSPMFSLDEKDKSAIKLYLLPRCIELNDKLFTLTDEDICHWTILEILYLKAIIYFHPYARNVIEENNNALSLKEVLDSMTGRKCNEVLKLLRLLNENI